MTQVYQKFCTQATNSQLVFDPTSGQYVLPLVQEPESSLETGDSGSFALSESGDDSSQPGAPGRPKSLADSDNLVMARRYRLAALTITNPDVRQQYLDKAASLAGDSDKKEDCPVSVPCYSPSPSHCSTGLTTGQSSSDNHNPDSLPGQTRVHSDLAQVIISSKEYTRPFVLWSVLRSRADGRGWFDIADVLDLAKQTGKAQSTLYNWLDQGENIFWNRDKGRLYLVGKDPVFSYFLGPDIQPGRIVYVPTNKLLAAKLHVVRAALSATWVTREDGQIAARETRKEVLQAGIPERTQQRYDTTSGVRKRFIYARHNGENFQISNWYGMPFGYHTRNTGRVSQNRFFGHRSEKAFRSASDFNAMVTHSLSELEANGGKRRVGLRWYFDDQKSAIETKGFREANNIDLPVYWIQRPESQGPIQAIRFW